MPPLDTFDELFNPQALSGLARRFADQSQNRTFLQVFQGGEKQQPPADSVSWDEVRYSRDIGTLVGPDAPSDNVAKTQTIARAGVMIDIKEHVDLPARWLFVMRNPGSDLPDAEARVRTEVENLTNRNMAAANLVAARALLSGSVDLSAIPGSKLKGTLAFPVQSAKQYVTTWAAAGTALRSAEINALKKSYLQDAGFKPGLVIASALVEQYVTQNTEVTKFITEGGLAGRMLQSSFMDGGGVAQFGGLEWQFCADHYATDAAPDTAVQVFANDKIMTVLPPRERWKQCYGWAEGKVYVPAFNGSWVTGVAGATKMIQEVTGFYAYVELLTNPVGLRLHVGMRFLPYQKVVNATMPFTTAP